MGEINIPHNWTPEKHQLPVLNNPARFKVIVWHRKAHKTTLALNQLIRMAALVRGTYWYIAPYYNQAKKIVWQDPEMLGKYVPDVIWKDRNNSELYFRMPNGSMVYVMGADHPDSLRGPNPTGVILDEYGDMKPEIWSGIIQPIMTANPHSWTWFMGTPKGKNDFWTKFNYAQGNERWYSSLLTAEESGIIPKDSLEEAKLTTTQAFFEQEYMCSFLEGAGQFFRRVRANLYDRNSSLPEYGDFTLGVDLGKYNDWTVLTPFNLNTFRVYPQTRFNQIDWNLQLARVEAVARKFQARLKVDRTGLGDPFVDQIKTLGLNMADDDAIVFTERSRMEMLNNLSILIEQDKIQLPDDEGLLLELESFRYVLTLLGKVKVAVPETMHDDRVMSLALAVWGATSQIPIDMVMHNPRFANREIEANLYMTDYN